MDIQILIKIVIHQIKKSSGTGSSSSSSTTKTQEKTNTNNTEERYTLSYSNLTSNSVLLNWTGTGSGYVWVYVNETSDGSVASYEKKYELKSLKSKTTYTVVLKNSSNKEVSNKITFTTK